MRIAAQAAKRLRTTAGQTSIWRQVGAQANRQIEPDARPPSRSKSASAVQESPAALARNLLVDTMHLVRLSPYHVSVALPGEAQAISHFQAGTWAGEQ